jgi:ubiquinone/menaquinone biosynthesis C-methylase UbiE
MRISYVNNSEQGGAEFWLKRVGWEPSEAAKKIVQENNPAKTNLVADIGGAHGRETFWFARHGFISILVEPNVYSLRFARERAYNMKLSSVLINGALPYLPIPERIVNIVDFCYTLHQIPDELKLASLEEIYRVLSPLGSLYSTSFGHWEGHVMPSSIFPIATKQAFLDLHLSAGFKPRGVIEERTDNARPYEKYWYGVFQKDQ